MNIDRKKIWQEIFRRYPSFRAFAKEAGIAENTLQFFLEDKNNTLMSTIEIIRQTLGYDEVEFEAKFGKKNNNVPPTAVLDRALLKEGILRRYGSMNAFSKASYISRKVLWEFFSGKHELRRRTIEKIRLTFGYCERTFIRLFSRK